MPYPNEDADLIQSERKRLYGQLTASAVALLLGIGLCGTDKSSGSLGGSRSFWGAVLIVPALLVALYVAFSLVGLKFAERRVRTRTLLKKNPKDDA